MKASMMLTHTKPRPPLPIPLRPRLIPKPSAPTARGIPSNVQIRKVASPTWKPLFLIMMYIRIRISVQEWSIGDSRWFSHGQSDQWFADRQTSGPNRRSGQVRSGRRRGRGWSLSQVRIALRAFAVAVLVGVGSRPNYLRRCAGRPAATASRWPQRDLEH